MIIFLYTILILLYTKVVHLPQLVRSLEFVVRRRKTTHYPLRQSPKANLAFSGRSEASPLPTTNFKVKRGFTLIEILVVITIIAILTGTGTVAYKNAVIKGDDGKRKQDLLAVKGALTLFYEDNHKYPPLDPANTRTASASDEDDNWIPDLVPNYLPKLPKDPKQSVPAVLITECSDVSKLNVYCYTVTSNRQSFTLWGQLQNQNDPEKNTDCLGEDIPSASYNYCLKPDL